MRASSASWIYTAATTVGYITRTAALSPTTEEQLEGSAMSNSEGLNPDAGVIAQKVIVMVLTSTQLSETEHKLLGVDDTSDSFEIDSPVSVVTITHESAVTISHPKITEAPSLFKRKLGSNRWDLIHEGIQGQKRDGTQCPTDYSLCPKSLNGGCCPSDRVCGTDSCLPTSAAPASACGQVGYIACALAEGGGCCQSNYVCAQAGCSPSAGVSYSQTCAVNSYLCPASLGYGCCRNGMGCALHGCYTTSISTFTLLETVTTTDASSNVQTLTSSIVTATTPVQPSGTASSDAGLIPKIVSSAVPIAKVEATAGPSTGNNGLTKPQIGGIIGGSVTFLIVILAAAFLILRRLNKVVKVANNSRTSSSGPRSGQSRQYKRPPMMERPDVDAMSVDPLMVTRSEVSDSIHRPSYQSGPWSSAHEVEANSPPAFHTPFSPQAPAHSHYPRGYAAVPPSEGNSGNRHQSFDSTPSSSATPSRSYFDLPIQSNRDSQSSRRPSQHGRNWSNASDQSGVSQMSDPAELDGEQQETSRRSSLSRALYGLGMGRMVSGRRKSNPPQLTGGPQNKPDYPPPITPGLGHIPEASESHDNVNTSAQPPSRTIGLSGYQLREAGLSNSQLREMTLHDANLYISPAPKPTPKDYDDPDGTGKSMIYG